MGSVYLAERVGAVAAPLVVVKRLRADLSGNLELRQMFLDETRLAIAIRHPNVVATRDAGIDAVGNPFLEMEWLEGVSLARLLREADPPLPVVASVLACALDGLHAAHELVDETGRPLGVVHRDASPHNVLVTRHGDVKVLDFGVAKAASASTRTLSGVVKGKTTYMAPEQAMRGAVDRRADLFVIGIVLWEALAGRRLWGDLPEHEALGEVVRARIPAPSSSRAHGEPSLEDVCMKALARAPEDRFASAAEMASALRGAIAERPCPPSRLAALVESRFGVELGQLRARVEAARAGAEPALDVPLLGLAAVPPSAEAETVAERIAPEPRAPASPASPRTRRRVALGALGALGVLGAAALLTALGRGRPGPSSAPLAAAQRCAVGTACRAGASRGPGRCDAQGACLPLDTARCRAVFGREGDADKDAVLVGTLLPASGPEADAFGRVAESLATLAIREIARTTNGLPTRDGVRPLALVACDDTADAESSARHLVALGAEAVIGFRTSDEAADIARDVLFPAGVLAFAALNQGALLSALRGAPGGPRLFFRYTASIGDRLAAAWRAVPQLVLSPSPRVLLLRPANATGTSAADLSVSLAREVAPSAVLADVSVGDPFARDDADRTRPAVARILDFGPDVVLVVADVSFEAVIAPVEARAKGRPILWIRLQPWEGAAFGSFLDAHPTAAARFLATSPDVEAPPLIKLANRFNAESGTSYPPSSLPVGTYDAVYAFAYARALAGDRAGVASAMARMGVGLAGSGADGDGARPGEPVEVGPTPLVDGLARAGRGEPVTIRGAGGSLRFPEGSATADMDRVWNMGLVCPPAGPGLDVRPMRLEGGKPGPLRCKPASTR